MRYLLRLSFCLLLLLCATFSAAQSQREPLKLLRVTPAGEDVPLSAQIVFEFNRPVVPLGRMERLPEEMPIAIMPRLACAWHWLNTTTLACELGEHTTMARATRYTVIVQPGIQTEDGVTLEVPFTHTFLTQRPKITEVMHQTWVSPGAPVLLVLFDQPVTVASVSRHVYVQTPTKKRLAVNASESPKHRGRGWFLRPVEELPQDTSVTVWVEPGMVSTQGREPGAEQRPVYAFDTLPPLRVLGLSCTIGPQQTITIPAVTRQLPPQQCDPQQLALLFSAPVRREGAQDALRFTPALTGEGDNANPWEDMPATSRLTRTHRRGNTYALPLPDLQWGTTYRLKAAPQRIKDEFGRRLAEAIDLQFTTAHKPPDLVVRYPISVLEQHVETHVPLEVLNLDAVHVQYETLTTQGRQAEQALTIPLQNEIDLGYRIPLKIRDLIPAASGVIQGKIWTTPMVGEEPQWFFSQVTPFHLHVKIGHYNTLAWVTAFDTGLPVRDVRVQLTTEQLDTLQVQPTVVAEAVTNADGLAVLAGTSTLDPALQLLQTWGSQDKPHVFVRLQKDATLTMVPLVHDFQVEAYGPNRTHIRTSLERRYGHIRTWGTTPQGVYRAGDTVQYKIYVRDQDNQRFIPAPRTGYRLQILDPTDKVVHTVQEVSLSEFGAYHGEFMVPQHGAVGWYSFVLSAAFARVDAESAEETDSTRTWEPMRVLISDFTPAPFRVTTDLHESTLVRPEDRVAVTTQAKLHAGGPYGAAEMRLTASVQGRPLVPQDPRAAGFYFTITAPAPATEAAVQATHSDADDEGAEESDDESDTDMDLAEDTSSATLHEVEDRLDDQGTLETTFAMPLAKVLYGQLYVESAVRDDRGKYVAGHATAGYAGRDRYVGLRQEDWVWTTGTPAQLQVLVVNEHGVAVAETAVQVKVEQLQIKAAQVKGAGNAYLPHYVRSWSEVATCTLVSEMTPGTCTFTPPSPGTYRLTASITDTQGRTHRTSIRRWATGAGEVLWETSPDHNLNIIPEQKGYKVGDTARYLVQNPFPGAQALVTIERFGVQQSWLETFNEVTAIVQFPVTPDHLPGFYLSVVVMSPRVAKPLTDNQVDLGKPTFRLGYVRTLVQDPYKELNVTVQPRQEVYKPRQTATVDLHVSTRQGEVVPVELAVAVLDEAVFDLIAGGRDYFDPYKGFYRLEALDLWNYNVLTQLIGRQKFAKKGANPGGDGGLDLELRSVFKFVSYWDPALVPDAAGKATISFELPDNLTGWRVLAMAVTPDDRMGLGEGHFKANKPTEIRPALPNQITAGDSFEASFTVLNRTETPRLLEVTLSATGPIQENAGLRQVLTAEPFKRYLMRLPVHTLQEGEMRLHIRAGDTQDHDALEMPLTIARPRNQALRVAATYGMTNADEVKESIAFPTGIRPDLSHLSVVATPTVIGGLEGVFMYMRDYPYACWEQKLTRGLMAAHYRSLTAYLSDTLQWPESQELPERTLALAANYQTPSGGMAYYTPEDQYVSPDLSAYTALAFTWLRARGYAIPTTVEARLHDYLLSYLRHDNAPDFYSRSMRGTIQAVALAALAPSGKVGHEDMQRYHTQVREMSLFGKAHYLLALTQVVGTAAMQAEVLDLIRAHANETSGKLVFSEEVDAAYKRILDSSLRSNCAMLSAFLASQESHQGRPTASDVPSKLVRTITQTRQNRTHWATTQENIFCMNALSAFSRIYEPDQPDLTLRAYLEQDKLGEAQVQTYKAPAVDFQHPLQIADVGRQATLTLTREGQGQVYYAVRLFYAPAELQTQAVNAGFEVHREYSVERGRGWMLLPSPMHLRLGELVKVDLYVSLPAARNFVVLDDPVPGGLEPVNRDLATASKVDADKAIVPHAQESFWFRYNDWRAFGYARWSFYHKELRHHAVRFYSEYLPAGRYHLSYVAQAIAPGEFAVMPLRAEEMYNPETYGQSAPATLRVLHEGQKEARQ
jgi:uncharacterized protein YfaS (alpha-2-macroglobulin family)